MPRVSVVIPVYNRADRCRPSLDSALSQTYHDFEVVVVDDGSTDGLVSVLEADYPSVRIVRHERNSGEPTARNRGVAEARGELIAFLDSDDLWSPDKLALQVADFDRHPDAVLSFTDIIAAPKGTDQVYSRTQPFQPERVFEQLLEGGPILPSAILFRKRDYETIGGFDVGLAIAGDRDFLLRLAPLGPFRFFPPALVRRVVYGDALSHRSELWKADFDRVVTRFLERPEGESYRPRARQLLAQQLVKIGSRHLRMGAWGVAVAWFGRATLREPLALFRMPARRWVADACWTRVRLVAQHRLWRRARRIVVRLAGRSTAAPRPIAVDTVRPAFRPPPDAPPRL